MFLLDVMPDGSKRAWRNLSTSVISGTPYCSDIDTQVPSSGTFEGITIAEAWRDSATGTHYALAVLDKAKTRQVLLGQLRAAADRTHGDLVRADTAQTYLGRGQALLDAVRSSAELDAIVSRARVVGRPSVVGLPGTGEIERDSSDQRLTRRFW